MIINNKNLENSENEFPLLDVNNTTDTILRLKEEEKIELINSITNRECDIRDDLLRKGIKNYRNYRKLSFKEENSSKMSSTCEKKVKNLFGILQDIKNKIKLSCCDDEGTSSYNSVKVEEKEIMLPSSSIKKDLSDTEETEKHIDCEVLDEMDRAFFCKTETNSKNFHNYVKKIKIKETVDYKYYNDLTKKLSKMHRKLNKEEELSHAYIDTSDRVDLDNATKYVYGSNNSPTTTKLLMLLQNLGSCNDTIKNLCKANMLPEDHFNLDENSSFLDIGSGVGIPCFHANIQVGCYCTGYDIRKDYICVANNFLANYSKKYFTEDNIGLVLNNNENNVEKVKLDPLLVNNKKFVEDLKYCDYNINQNKVRFECVDACELYKYFDKMNNNKDFTHIYSYNRIFEKSVLRRITKVLNNTDFKVLVWSIDPKSSFDHLELQNCEFIGKTLMKSSSGNQNFVLYIYVKVLK